MKNVYARYAVLQGLLVHYHVGVSLYDQSSCRCVRRLSVKDAILLCTLLYWEM